MIQLFLVLVAFLVLSAGLAWFLIRHDQGEREPVGALWLAFGLGTFGGVVAGLLESFFIPKEALILGANVQTLFIATMAIGVIEEACKFLPLAFVIFNKRFFNEHTDGVIYFALAGLGFGLPENIMYTAVFGAQVGMERALLTPFFHAAITGMVGFYLIKLKLAHKSPLGIIPVLIAAMFIHGLYDFGLLVGATGFAIMSLLVTISLSASIFVLYFKAKELDQNMGLSAVGHNSFCRTCGAPNRQHNLYCTKCGKNA